jgi:uncharacterized membrane protein
MPRETPSARSASSGTGDPTPGAPSAQIGVFRKEGEFWTVGYGGKSFRLKDTKGVGYVAHLLRHPTVEFHVLDLAGGIAGQGDDDETSQSAQGLPGGPEALEKAGIHIGSLGDAGEMLDDQARAAYRQRLSELREEPAFMPWQDSSSIRTKGRAEWLYELALFPMQLRARSSSYFPTR